MLDKGLSFRWENKRIRMTEPSNCIYCDKSSTSISLDCIYIIVERFLLDVYYRAETEWERNVDRGVDGGEEVGGGGGEVGVRDRYDELSHIVSSQSKE